MKRGLLILIFGLLTAAVAYFCSYQVGISAARKLQKTDQPELAWLQQEFKLSDQEFKRISELHAAYLPHCAEMCRRIDEQNTKLRNLLAAADQMTGEIEAAIAESARLRGECQRDMLNHFFEVSRTMPPEQGKRYLAWVQERTLPATTGMNDHM